MSENFNHFNGRFTVCFKEGVRHNDADAIGIDCCGIKSDEENIIVLFTDGNNAKFPLHKIDRVGLAMR